MSVLRFNRNNKTEIIYVSVIPLVLPRNDWNIEWLNVCNNPEYSRHLVFESVHAVSLLEASSADAESLRHKTDGSGIDSP